MSLFQALWANVFGVEFIVFPNSKIYLIDNSKASKDVPLMLMRSKREGRGHRTMVHSMEGAPCYGGACQWRVIASHKGSPIDSGHVCLLKLGTYLGAGIRLDVEYTG